MPRYIDADKLKDTLQNLAYDDWNQGVTTSWATAYSECAELVDSMPTVDVEPVKHGHWIPDNAQIADKCSVCGLSVNWERYKTPYCPLCGAKMDERKEDVSIS